MNERSPARAVCPAARTADGIAHRRQRGQGGEFDLDGAEAGDFADNAGMSADVFDDHGLPQLPGRDPQDLLEQTLATRPEGDLWVFGYGSLIWRPEVSHDEVRSAGVWGWRRTLRMWSRINRGTEQSPGLVFALMAGGSCRGIALRVPQRLAERELRLLWKREMPRAVYDPRWLACHTPQGVVQALAFTLAPRSPSYTGELDDARLIDILRTCRGRYGTTFDYVSRTAQALRELGIRDAEVERIMRLARLHRIDGPAGA
jgi:cation transport protein ChaC